MSPEHDPELFWATAGGMGLTGVVVSATLRLIPIETSWMQVDSQRFTGARSPHVGDGVDRRPLPLQRRLARLPRSPGRCSPLGADAGRPRPLRCHPRPPARAKSGGPGEPRFQVPRAAPAPSRQPALGAGVERGLVPRSPRPARRLRPLAAFFHPLDGVGRWNLLYGPDGFVQYQFAVPAERGDVVEAAVETIASSGVPSFLAVLKRFGPGTPGPLSFAQEGWTLALDFPIGPAALPGLLDRLDDEVAAAGGRVYLAKDARLRPELLPAMYPRLCDMIAVCRRVDPDGVLASDLSRRLGLAR